MLIANSQSSSPEIELLLSCSRTQITPSQIERIQYLVKQSLDWDYLLAIASEQGVLPLLYSQLITLCFDALPQEVKAQLQERFSGNLQHNLWLTGELLKLVDIFTNHGIPVLAFKGPTLTQRAYNNLGLRQFIDLDILVPEAQVAHSTQLLMSQGYQPQFPLTIAQQATYTRLRHEHFFWHKEKQTSVDLHWYILPRYYSFSPNPELLWARSDRLKLANQSVTILSDETLLLFLCAHGAKHNWSRLCWICDVAQLLHTSSELDWGKVQHLAEQLGTRRMLFLGLYLAHHLLDAILPEELWRSLAAERTIPLLAQRVQNRLFQPQPAPSRLLLDVSIYLKTMESWRDRMWYWIDTILTPTPLEWQIIVLPRLLFPFYYPIRVIRLVLKFLKNITTKSKTISRDSNQ